MRNNEIWKDIKGYEGLAQVSNFGRVRTLDRTVTYIQVTHNGMFPTEKKLKGRILKFRYGKNKYIRVNLMDKDFYVHKLVVSNFLRPLRPKEEVNHIDGNKQNNYIDNLEIVSRIENQNHAYFSKLNTKIPPGVPVFINGTYYPSLVEAERGTKIPKTFIMKILKNPKTKRRKWKKVDIKPAT